MAVLLVQQRLVSHNNLIVRDTMKQVVPFIIMVCFIILSISNFGRPLNSFAWILNLTGLSVFIFLLIVHIKKINRK